MNRRALAAMLATATLVVGCARSRAALPPSRATAGGPIVAPALAPAEIRTIEPIRTSINQGKIPADLDTVRASYAAEEAPTKAASVAETPPVASPPAPTAMETAPPVVVTKPEPPAVVDVPVEPPPVTSAAPDDAAAPPVLATPPEATSPPAEPPPAAGGAGADEPRPKPIVPGTDAPASAPEADPAPAKAEGSDAIRLKTDPGIEPGKRAARVAAMVGGTVITVRELEAAVCNRLEMTPREVRELPTEDVKKIAKGTLESLIDNALLLQEAQREMKKNWKMFTDYAEKSWHEKEVPRRLRKLDVEDEFALRKAMEAKGESLDDAKDMFKQEMMARDFLMIRLQDKVTKPGKPDLEAYYAKHRNDPGYHREAKVDWHEILVPAASSAELPKARQDAEALRARVARGEDFAALARSSSAGATAAKGGAWDTSPGGNPVAAINAALESLPPGELSAPIDGPRGVHLVRVDRRTAAGPVPFVEVQNQIAKTLLNERFAALVEGYLKKLREKTTITSPLFAGASSAPSGVQEVGKTDAEARRAAGP